eukprot:CAMPEP_0171111068 /NCGR_PEP_ID=MMETSP0766_2-20121228/73668_1 /TAXON_ID=439317 /ORGANISM="Gambierdiscus australes, Strain CAWD 149" /LENGTH=73 /DNA_ID=CAMNT_0011573009 /DNA_START=43 /DNA_END=261 /DNA_ORIENTATION=-
MRASARLIFCLLVDSEKNLRRILRGIEASAISFNDLNSKVWYTTLNITPTRADTGIQLMTGPATKTMSIKKTP